MITGNCDINLNNDKININGLWCLTIMNYIETCTTVNTNDINYKRNSNENICNTIGNNYKLLYNWSKWTIQINALSIVSFEKLNV